LTDLEGAERHYQAFLRGWEGADDLPVRREALDERRQLGR